MRFWVALMGLTDAPLVRPAGGGNGTAVSGDAEGTAASSGVSAAKSTPIQVVAGSKSPPLEQQPPLADLQQRPPSSTKPVRSDLKAQVSAQAAVRTHSPPLLSAPLRPAFDQSPSKGTESLSHVLGLVLLSVVLCLLRLSSPAAPSRSLGSL